MRMRRWNVAASLVMWWSTSIEQCPEAMEMGGFRPGTQILTLAFYPPYN